MLAGDVKQAPQMVEIQGAPPVEQVAGEDFRRTFAASVSKERGSAMNELTTGSAKATFSDLATVDSAVRGRVKVSSAELKQAVASGSEGRASVRQATTTKTLTAATMPSPLATVTGTASRLTATTTDTVPAAAALSDTGAKSTAALHAEEQSTAQVIAAKLAVVPPAPDANAQRLRVEVAATPQRSGAENLSSIKITAPSQKKTTGAASTHDAKQAPKTDAIVSAVASIEVQTVAKPEAARGLQPIEIAEPVPVSPPVQMHAGVLRSEGPLKSSPALQILPGTPVGNAASELKSSVVSVVRGDLQAIPSVPASDVGVQGSRGDAAQRDTTHRSDAAPSIVADSSAPRGPSLLHLEEAASETSFATVNPAAASTQTSNEAGPKPVSTAETLPPSLAVAPSSESKFTHSLVQVVTNSSEGGVGSAGRTEFGRGAPARRLNRAATETPEEFAPTSVLPAGASASPPAEVAATDSVVHERTTSDPAAASKTTSIDAKRSGADAGLAEPAVRPVTSLRSAPVTPPNAASVSATDDSASGNKEIASTVRVEPPSAVAASSPAGSSAIVAATSASAGNAAVATLPTVPAGTHRESVGVGSIAETHVAGLATRLGISTVSDFATASDAHRTLIATPTTLEVGVRDGGQEWLKIRAEVGGGGGVTASLAAASNDAQETLKGQLPALNAYLNNEHLMVTTTVTERSFVPSASGLGGLAAGADGSSWSNSPGSSHGYNGQGQMDSGLLQGGDQRQAGGRFTSDPERRDHSGAGTAGAELVSGISAMTNAHVASPGENGHRLNVRV